MKELIHMYRAAESARSEIGPFVIRTIIFMTVFIRRVPVEDNTAQA